jgi:hypothetical protein
VTTENIKSIHVMVFWVMTLYNGVVGYQHFGGTCCLHLQKTTTSVSQNVNHLASHVILDIPMQGVKYHQVDVAILFAAHLNWLT